MFSFLSKSLSFALALSLAFTPALQAKQITTTAPIPTQIAQAHTIFVSNGGGSNYFNQFTGGPDRAYNSIYAELQQSGHYQLVDSPSQADLIFEIRSIAPTMALADPDNTGPDFGYNPQLILSILDPQTKAVLWTTSANVRAIGTQKRRDRQFDQSVAVVVDKLAEVTGQSLTSAQIKAIDSNSRWSTAAKVWLTVGVVAFAGLTTYGVYRATHPPTLAPLPTLSPFPATR